MYVRLQIWRPYLEFASIMLYLHKILWVIFSEIQRCMANGKRIDNKGLACYATSNNILIYRFQHFCSVS